MFYRIMRWIVYPFIHIFMRVEHHGSENIPKDKGYMLAANKQFLFTQKAAGKQFWFSHNPMTTLQNYPNSFFAMELNWLKDSYGLTKLTSANFVKSGSYWYFVP